MKTIKYSSLLLMLVMSACDDFLSKPPDNRSDLDTAEKISELLVSAYPEANYITFCEAMTNNVSDHGAGVLDNTNRQPFFWEDASETEQDSPEFYWSACYAAIAAANHALKAIAEAEDPSLYDAQKGEALVARAYSHFMLVNLFAKTYTDRTSSTDLGIPYVTEPETTAFKSYQRHTVKYVYDKIETDFKAGIPLINDESYTVPSYHFTKAAAHAFAVRFYLFKKAYNSVIEHANLVFPDKDFASRLRPWNTTYQDYAYDELVAAYTKATEKSNLLLCETSSLWARYYTSFRYSTGVLELQEIRSISNLARGDFAYTVYYTSTNNIYFIVKFREHFVREDISADIGLPYTIVPLLTAEEVLLSRAEAYAYQQRYTEALADINTFFSKRIADYDPAEHTVTQQRLATYFGTSNTLATTVETVIELRRVEFLHEGLWWFDILRYNIPLEHVTFDEDVFELPADDLRRRLQIPQEAIEISGLKPNPR